MVHWFWIPVTLVVGIFFGIFIIALLEASKNGQGEDKWWDK